MLSDKPAATRPKARGGRWSAIGRPLAALVGLGCLGAAGDGRFSRCAPCQELSPSAAVSVALARRGLHTKPCDVRWVDPPIRHRHFPIGSHRFVALVEGANEPADVWLGRARLSPEGRWLDLSALHNLSDTSAVAEATVHVSGERVAWLVTDRNEVVAIQVLDLKGRALTAGDELTLLERWQTRLTFLQETGQLAGICRRAYRFERPPSRVDLAWTDAGLRVETTEGQAILRCDGTATNAQGLVAEPTDLGSPGDLVTWAVDRVRAMPWFGTERMQWLKAVTFEWLDRFDTVKRRIVKPNDAARLHDQVGEFLSNATTRTPDPETGWPPPPMQPVLSPPLPGEGIFRPLDDDPFAVPAQGAPSPFAFSFLRTDSNRPDAELFVVVWDPRLIELHTMTGTREPKTATGETGSGTVPRDHDIVGRLAGAFNGGFQATHGEFGMMAQRVVYLPPKPYAATIAELSDGTSGFGTWPDDEAIPETLVGFRQNLTPLVADGRANPYGRTWWGGVPAGWQDATRTVRTGLCLTREHFIAYFYASSIDAEHLATAMLRARCEYGAHLDMNPGHTGFEFYRVAKSGTLPAVPHKLDPTWEARASVPGTSGWEFLGRRMLRTMHLMHFPRYVRTDSRDFFYLTHRYVLPPPPASIPGDPSHAASSTWQVRNHAQHGYPPAVASRRFRPDPARPELEVALVVLDAKWLLPCSSNCDDSAAIAQLGRPRTTAGIGVYHHSRKFLATSANPPQGAVPIAFGKDDAHASKTIAAVGIAHDDWLYYAEIHRGGGGARDVALLKRLLTELGCDVRVYLEQSLDLSLGDPTHAPSRRGDVMLLRDDTPMATRLFNDTAVVPAATWQPLQAKRVRYVRQRSATLDARPTHSDPPSSSAHPLPAADVEN